MSPDGAVLYVSEGQFGEGSTLYYHEQVGSEFQVMSVTRAAIPPTVTKVRPKSGHAAGGRILTIKGSGLVGATAVKFGSIAAASFSVDSETSITAVSPPGRRGTVDVT